MKNIFTLLILVAAIPSLYGQVVAVLAGTRQTLYMCVQNPVKIAVSGIPSYKIIATINNGRICRDDRRPGYYFAEVDREDDNTKIYVKQKTSKGLKTIDSTKFYVRRYIRPDIWLAQQSGGDIEKTKVFSAPGLSSTVDGMCINPPIHSCNIIITRHGWEIFNRKMLNEKNNAAYFDEVTIDQFYKLRKNDRLQFTDIKYRDCDGKVMSWGNLEFLITDTAKFYRPRHGESKIEDPVTGEMKTVRW